MAVGVVYVFSGFLTAVLTQLFFPKPPTIFLTYFCRGGRRKHAGKKSRLNRGSNSQPPGHESDTLTTEPPGRREQQVEKIGSYDSLRKGVEGWGGRNKGGVLPIRGNDDDETDFNQDSSRFT